MVALEALREALGSIDSAIDHLGDCIDDNHSDIDDNEDDIEDNDYFIDANADELEDQRDRLDNILVTMNDAASGMGADTTFLILHCQQFAFSVDMVGPCANLLSCAGTELPYKWDGFTSHQ